MSHSSTTPAPGMTSLDFIDSFPKLMNNVSAADSEISHGIQGLPPDIPQPGSYPHLEWLCRQDIIQAQERAGQHATAQVQQFSLVCLNFLIKLLDQTN